MSKVIVVTGSTCGIGYRLALSQRGHLDQQCRA